jgi:hypothetical protein
MSTMYDVRTDAQREQLIFGEVVAPDRVVRFARDDFAAGDPITPATGRELLEEGFMPASMRQNGGPTMGCLVEIAEDLDAFDGVDVRLTGYVVPASRADARVTVTGIVAESEGAMPAAVCEVFREWFGTFGDADELTVEDEFCSAWWD